MPSVHLVTRSSSSSCKYRKIVKRGKQLPSICSKILDAHLFLDYRDNSKTNTFRFFDDSRGNSMYRVIFDKIRHTRTIEYELALNKFTACQEHKRKSLQKLILRFNSLIK
ncbi:hypothetical protein GQX74_003981 [Glossina fuscipes]|nr:hypothetical protein GQX74_003981 [Glossina fuscipes]